MTQKEETVVQMQNGQYQVLYARPFVKTDLALLASGCICCTLRGDLLEEIADLAEKQEFE